MHENDFCRNPTVGCAARNGKLPLFQAYLMSFNDEEIVTMILKYTPFSRFFQICRKSPLFLTGTKTFDN